MLLYQFNWLKHACSDYSGALVAVLTILNKWLFTKPATLATAATPVKLAVIARHMMLFRMIMGLQDSTLFVIHERTHPSFQASFLGCVAVLILLAEIKTVHGIFNQH